MLWSKRRSSRSDLSTRRTHVQPQLSPSRRPSLPPNSISRLPLAPLDLLDPQASQSSFAAATEDMASYHHSSASDSDASIIKRHDGRQSGRDQASDNKSSQSSAYTASSRRPQPDRTLGSPVTPLKESSANNAAVSNLSRLTDPSDADLYTYNSLHSFSFGSVQAQPSPRSPNPLSPLQSDADNASDEFSFPSDVTPRPSVIAYRPTQVSSRSHPTQPSPQSDWPPSGEDLSMDCPPARVDRGRDRDRARGGDSDASSHLESSSASASVTSFSSNSVGLSRHGSSASHRTDTTTQTSANDLSSTDDDEDRHRPVGSHRGNHMADEFSSDEDYSDYEDDEYYDHETGMSIEIGSAQYEGSVGTHEWDRELYAGSSASVRTLALAGVLERRGSLPMAIPGAPLPSDTRGDTLFPTARDREDSLATLRRPSRSLDDDFHHLGYSASRGPDSVNHRVGEDRSNRPVLPAPVSVPESDGDWKTLHERRVLKGKAREMDTRTPPTASGVSNRYQPSQGPRISISNQGNAMDGFDLDWSALQGGITGFDRSHVADIIQPNNNGDPNIRRPSYIGSKWLPWGNNGARRPSTATFSSGYGDTFGKAIGKWGGEDYRAERKVWSYRKEKPESTTVARGAAVHGESLGRSSTGFLSSRGSTTTETSGPSSPAERERERERQGSKELDKEKSSKAAPVWRGMRVGSQEIWRNDLAGRFRVDRRANKPPDPTKGPQQRLVVAHIRDNNASPNTPSGGPPVTIHKHSKAIAFSISRHYRQRPIAVSTNQGSSVGMRGDFRIASSPSIGAHEEVAVVAPTKKSSSMVLLAPRRVQEAFTSTNTTRKLESHGLLEDKIVEVKDREKPRRHREREREGVRDREGVRERGMEREREKQKERERKLVQDSKGKGRSKSKDDSQIPPRSAGATIGTLQPMPPPATAPMLHTKPPGSTSSLESTLGLSPTDRSSSRTSSRTPRRRRRVRDPLDDDSDSVDAPLPRTPHSETYGTMDPNVIEQMRPRQSDLDSGSGFLKRLIRGRSAHAVAGPSSGQPEPYYDPPWIVLVSRSKQEHQQRVVDNLNTSFKDVGLLPSNHKDKSKRRQNQKKITNGGSDDVDIFAEVPLDSLYMLLPLWPGDTDPITERNGGATEKPNIPSEKRLYLLIYYKLMPDAAVANERAKSKDEGEGKKRSRNSPTSSQESTKREDRSSILLPSFHITARLVSYKSLQGCGVRVPDEGLTVTGPLNVAVRTMPVSTGNEAMYGRDWVIGVCHSRDAGIEFYQEGLVKMGLCLQTSEPAQVQKLRSEEDVPEEPDVELTPVGKAVLEMAWLGGLALTSFGPGN